MESIQELRGICQKEGISNSYTERIQRAFSIYVTWLLLQTPISANQVSFLTIALGLICAAQFAVGDPRLGLASALLLNFWSTLDYVDGEIARYRKSAGLTGAYVDRLNHVTVEPILFAAISFGLYRQFQTPFVFLLGFSAGFSRLLNSMVVANMYVSAAEAKTHSGLPKQNKAGNYVPHRRVFTLRRSWVFQLIWFMYFGLGKIWLWLLASFVDIRVSPISIATFTFNAMYLIQFIYGVLSPLSWIGLAYLIVRRRSTEALYWSLFS